MSTRVQPKGTPLTFKEARKNELRELASKSIGALKERAYKYEQEDGIILSRAKHALVADEYEVEVEGLEHKLNTCQYIMYMIGATICLTVWSRSTIKKHQSESIAKKAEASMNEMMKSAQDKQNDISKCMNLMERSRALYINAQRQNRQDEARKQYNELKTQIDIKKTLDSQLQAMNTNIDYYRNQFLAMQHISMKTDIDQDKREVARALGPHLTTNVSEVVRDRRQDLILNNGIKKELERDHGVSYEFPEAKNDSDVMKYINEAVDITVLIDDEEETESNEYDELNP
jgi:hypothetical protein